MAASKPISSLFLNIDTFHPLTLNQYFGTLTIVWVVPLSGLRLTPEPLSPGFYDAIFFGVGQETDQFPSLNLKSVALQLLLSHPRLDYGQLW